jgi:hypothetical protein
MFLSIFLITTAWKNANEAKRHAENNSRWIDYLVCVNNSTPKNCGVEYFN